MEISSSSENLVSGIEHNNRLRHHPSGNRAFSLRDPHGKEVTYRYGQDRKRFLRYLRIGKTWFLDPSFFPPDSEEVKQIPSGDIIWIAPGEEGSKPLHWSHHPYTASILHALTYAELTGKTVLDLGCGNGLLGVQALKLGASKVIGIDNDGKWESEFNANAKGNGFSDKMDFRSYDLSSPEKWLSSLDTEAVEVFIANIGPHYGDIDLLSIRLLEKFPNALTFIGGGYVLPLIKGHHSLVPDRAYEELETQGFTVTLELKEIIREEGLPEKQNRLSFVAAKSQDLA